jgi:lipopolysaccharide/colanic/teichoic acid biosynthesis glycosyltransferase
VLRRVECRTGAAGTDARREAAVGYVHDPRSRRGPLLLKRTLDVLLGALVLAAMVPLIAVVVLAILVESPGPILYRAERVGRSGRPFRMLKFRKMRPESSGLRLTTRNDDRLTRVGAFLARSKLDELPQIINVLRGDMSLIGPRPEDPGFVARRQGDYDGILRVRPGITGLAQIAFAEESEILSEADPVGHYLDAIFPQKCQLDRLYVQSASVRTDIRILLWTFVAIGLKRPVAVDRATGRMRLRRRRGATAGARALPTHTVLEEYGYLADQRSVP